MVSSTGVVHMAQNLPVIAAVPNTTQLHAQRSISAPLQDTTLPYAMAVTD